MHGYKAESMLLSNGMGRGKNGKGRRQTVAGKRDDTNILSMKTMQKVVPAAMSEAEPLHKWAGRTIQQH